MAGNYQSYKSQVLDRLWDLAEFSAPVRDMVLPLVRLRPNRPVTAQKGWLRLRSLADFPAIWIGSGRFVHGAFTDDPVLAQEDAAFAADGGEWGVAATFVYTAKVLDLPEQMDRLNQLDERLKLAWLAGGPKLMRSDVSPPLAEMPFVKGWGPLGGRGPEETIREPLANGQRVLVAQTDIPVTIELDGQTLLAGTRET